jgi:hypothetical protein
MLILLIFWLGFFCYFCMVSEDNVYLVLLLISFFYNFTLSIFLPYMNFCIVAQLYTISLSRLSRSLSLFVLFFPAVLYGEQNQIIYWNQQTINIFRIYHLYSSTKYWITGYCHVLGETIEWVWLDEYIIDHLQVVTTNNYNTIANLHTNNHSTLSSQPMSMCMSH